MLDVVPNIMRIVMKRVPSHVAHCTGIVEILQITASAKGAKISEVRWIQVVKFGGSIV